MHCIRCEPRDLSLTLELEFRHLLWRAGVRGYRVHLPLLPGRPDLYFPSAKLAVFIHGCFWHRCPVCDLKPPKINAEFWTNKFAATLERDDRAVRALMERGIAASVVWEHEIEADPVALVDRIRQQLRARPGALSRVPHPSGHHSEN